jgi:predicted dehydrogenase
MSLYSLLNVITAKCGRRRIMFSVGFIGLEGHYGAILRDIPMRQDVRLAAIATRDANALDRARSYEPADADTGFYLDYREMLEKEKLDLVTICLTDGERAQVIQDCAQAGVHIISEKPLAMNMEQLSTIRKVVADNHIQLSMLLTMRFEGTYLAVRDIVERGTIGEVIQMTAQKSYKLGQRPEWMKHRDTFSGIIPYIGIHAIDLLRWTSGREFVEVAAFQSNVAHPEIGDMEDNATVAFRMDNAGTASVRLDYLRSPLAPTHGDATMRLAGTRGIVEVANDGEDVTLMTTDQPPESVSLPPSKSFLSDLLDSLKGEHSHLIPMEDAFRVTEICLKARQAAERHEVLECVTDTKPIVSG